MPRPLQYDKPAQSVATFFPSLLAWAQMIGALFVLVWLLKFIIDTMSGGSVAAYLNAVTHFIGASLWKLLAS